MAETDAGGARCQKTDDIRLRATGTASTAGRKAYQDASGAARAAAIPVTPR